MTQFDLFAGERLVAEPPYSCEPDNVRQRIAHIIGQLRSADQMPWPPAEERMYRNIVPQMTNWLPREEAASLKNEFDTELSRLAI